MEKNTDLLASQNNIEQTITNKESYSLINTEEIKGSPLTYVEADGKHFICLGNNRVSEIRESKEETLKDLTHEMYNIIIRCIWVIYDDIKKLQE